MTDGKVEQIIKNCMVNGYFAALDTAHFNGVSVDDFKSVARQILLGLFLSVNEIGMDDVPGPDRILNLEHNLKEFVDAGMTIFDRQLCDEENAARAGVTPNNNLTSDSALRLCDEKSLTNQNAAGEIGPRQEQGEVCE